MMLRAEGLDVFYGDVQALDSVTLEIEEGAIVAIVGANGAGKTTLIRALGGMHRPARGRITFRGIDISDWPSHRVCNLGIGQVAEGRQVFPTLSVAENLDVGAMLPRARRQAKRNLDEVFAMFPRLAERRAQLAGTLSGGEQQMLAIGRCLMGAPELIMFDEPSLGLAPLVVQEVLHTIRLLNERGMTILKAGFVASLPAICGFLGGIAGGWLSDRLARRNLSLSISRKTPIVIGMLMSTSMIACNYIGADALVVAVLVTATPDRRRR